MKMGILMADKYFLEEILSKNPSTTSGSCAISLLVIGNKLFIANVGDSRAIASYKNGKIFKAISRDHKPNDKDE